MTEIKEVEMLNMNQSKELREIGLFVREEVKVFQTTRDFYKHRYNLLDSYNFEVDVIELLKQKEVDFIKIVEIHKNNISNIDEKTIYLFPLILIEKFGIPVEHKNSGFSEQLAIKRDDLQKFIIQNEETTKDNNTR